eukprot:CAMPEP_0195018852 /NCGR_PEP_ID=MMETSP0326_2-20130528/31359_1 /TAXON_ID=2866 ORGANISM="Crypthecodinium cohnii, Strain Seligo" /NCGR_SAMPLE_ID=MMETSP0326_2 /ASSEMBLY_ACC=CAM_ASM_000348 /LENGTH=37 /DNA_ID= /DNA_START= /DNA_END= /DNA_ORIENTATION=
MEAEAEAGTSLSAETSKDVEGEGGMGEEFEVKEGEAG